MGKGDDFIKWRGICRCDDTVNLATINALNDPYIRRINTILPENITTSAHHPNYHIVISSHQHILTSAHHHIISSSHQLILKLAHHLYE